MEYDIVIRNTEIISKNDGKEYNIGIQGKRIAAITEQPLEGKYIIDGFDKIAVPGMVNAHTHTAMTLFRSYADDMVLMDWLQNKIWPAENNLTGEDVYWGTQLAIAEMLKTGTTCFADMYFFMDETAQAVNETGFRASLSRGITGTGKEADVRIKENAELFKKWHNSADGRIKVMLGPHAIYTCPKDTLNKIIKNAQKIGSEIHVHLSETKGEVEDCLKQQGKTPVAYLNDLGMFETGTLAAHCVHVSEADMDILADKHVRVVHNPQSNLKLASGFAPIAAMKKHNILIALGADGASSNNNLDMLEEARLASLLQKNLTGDPTALPAKETLSMVTENGYKALDFADIGEIKVGNIADVVLYDMDKPQWYPRNDRYSLFIYAASGTDADTVLVNGKVLMEKGKLLTIDLAKVYAEVNKRAKRLVNNVRE
ncbi:MAG: amidohydrolase [Acidaminococcaceae bacterium]|jgi:5-methylthioadenosine/S-adenosylhomocysteine deaminase|nr:amidohydrolase [Acidaminococcaceae bacterium]